MPSDTLRFFAYEHLPLHLRGVGLEMCRMAHEMEDILPDSTEKSVGMRKLLEARDCFVRAATLKPAE